MRLKNPVADVDDVDVLFDNDVAGKRAIVHPVAEAALGGRGAGPSGTINVPGEVVGFAAGDFAEGAAVNPPDHFDERRTIPDLEANIETELAFSALADFDDLFRAGHVHADGLFEIDVLAGGDDGLHVLRMKVRRRGDDDRIDFLRSGNFVESVRADEELRRVNGTEAFGLLELVEIGVSRIELVLKQIGERHDPCAAGVDQIRGIFGAAPAAAQQSNAYGGIGGGATHEFGLDEHQPGRGHGGADEFAAVELVGGVNRLFCFV